MSARMLALIAAGVLAPVALAETPPFVNKVWVVAESRQVAPGELRVFLSEGTLVMVSRHGKPAFGSWSWSNERLTITEEGVKYAVDVLELDEDTFRIRIHSPGEPVEIRFAPADERTGIQTDDWVELLPAVVGSTSAFRVVGNVQHLNLEGGVFVIRDSEGVQYNPMNLPEAFRIPGLRVEADARRREDTASIGMVGPIIELVRIRRQAGGDPEPTSLPGTTWRLEDLAGKGVIDRVQATLEFPAQGKASGHGSCNRFSGNVMIEGTTIKFDALATTRMACAEAVMNQEKEYLEALQAAQRFEVKDGSLYLHVANRDAPLRFVAQEPPGK